jgi:uncharacterized low-complexity protein
MTTPTLASALALALTTVALMMIVRCSFAQEAEDCGAEPHIAPQDFE